MRAHHRLFAALVLASLQPLAAHAATTYYWDGFTGDWTNLISWSTTNSNQPPTISGGVPGSADTAVFSAAGVTIAQNVILYSGALTNVPEFVGGLVFNSPATVTINQGNTNGGIAIGSGGITVSPSAAAVTINSLVQLTANQTWTVTPALTGISQINLGTFTLSLSTTSSWSFPNQIEGTGGLNITGGTINLSGNNTYSGATTVSGGAFVNVLSPQALGTGSGGSTTTVSAGATINFNGQSTVAEALNITGFGVNNGGAIIDSDVSFNPVNLTSKVLISNGSAAVGGTSPLTLSGAVSSADLVSIAEIVKVGASTLTLSGTSNNPALSVYVAFGTVVLGKTSSATVHAVGTGGLQTDPGATARLAGSGGDQINDTAVVINNGTFDLNGQTEAIDTLVGTGLVTNFSTNPAGLTLGVNNSSYTIGNNIQNAAGAVGITTSGNGTLTFTGTNTFTGGLNIASGTVIPGNPQALGAPGNSLFISGTLDLHGVAPAINSMTLQGSMINSGSSVTLSGAVNSVGTITGTGSINLAGAVTGSVLYSGTGTLTLSGSSVNTSLILNMSSGTVVLAKTSGAGAYAVSKLIINGGLVQLAGTGGQQLDPGGFVSIQGGTLDLNGQNLTLNNSSQLNNGGTLTNSAAGTTSTFSPNLTPINSTLQDGLGKLALTISSFGGANAAVINNAASYSGPTSISSGTLAYGNLNIAPPQSAFNISAAGTLDMQGNSQSIGSLSGAGSVLSNFGSGILTVGNDNTSTTFSGTLANGNGTLGLNKVGLGTTSFTGNNTFTGPLTVSAGALILGSSSSLGTPSAISIAAGATLDIGGASPGSAPLTLQGTLLDSGIFPATFSGNVNNSVSGSATVNGLGQFTFAGGFNNSSGATTLTKLGGNTLAFAGTADDTNLSLTVNAGTVLLGKTSSASVHAIGGNLVVNSGAAVYLAGTGGDQIADTSTVTLNGTFDLNGRNETVGNLNSSGLVTNSSSAAATLTVGGGNITGVFQSASGGGSITLSKIGVGSVVFSGTSPIAATVNVTVGRAYFYFTQHVSALSISSGALGLIQPNATAPYPILVTNSVSVAGTLDMSNGNLLVESTPANFAADFTNILAMVTTGHNGTGGGNHWNGTGITSDAATRTGTELTGLALSSGTDYLAANGPNATFDGQPVDAYSILVSYTYVGDANLDGKITLDDYLALDHGYLTNATGYTHGDFNYDNTINFKDYALLDNAYRNQSGPLADGEIALHTAEFGQPYVQALNAINPAPVPEPASLALLIPSFLLMRRRKTVRLADDAR